jgi:hypothetical protein
LASAIGRAHSLAAQITAATGVPVEIGRRPDGVSLHVELHDRVTTENWNAVLLALGNLPASDRTGGERRADGTVRLWALFRDDIPLETIP